MIATLLAIGVIPQEGGEVVPPIGPIDVPADTTIKVKPAASSGGTGSGIPIGAFAWTRPFDPSDRVPYAYDWSELLAEDETIASIERVTMSALGAQYGLMVDDSVDRLPMFDPDGKKVQLWFRVATGMQSNAAFSGTGVLIPVSLLIRSTAEPFREYERTGVLTVRQQ